MRVSLASVLMVGLAVLAACAGVSTDAAGHFEATGGPKTIELGSHTARGERLTVDIEVSLERGAGRLQVAGPNGIELDEPLAADPRAYTVMVPSGAAGAWRVRIEMSSTSIAGGYTVEWRE